MSEWQPIETAPKGRNIILFAVTDLDDLGAIRNWRMQTGCQSETGEWYWCDRWLKPYDIKPTHWQPLPDPPKEPAP